MKSTIWIFLILFFVSCAEPYRGFVLDGKVQGADNEMVYLGYTDTLGNWMMDSVLVQNGKFRFKGGITEPTRAMLSLGKISREMDAPNQFRCWLEPVEMTMEVTKDQAKEFILKGSATHDDEQKLETLKKPVTEELQPLSRMYYAEKDRDKALQIKEQMEPLYDRMNVINEGFMNQNSDSYVTLELLRYKVGSLSCDKAQEYYDRLSDRLKNSQMSEEIRDEIRKLRMGSPGSTATVFGKPDINGEMFSLADLKGKHVLIDFWASWCVPCRKSNPHLKEVYKKYKPQGFEVVCVADDDRNEGKWKEAVEKDGIQEFRHVLRGLKWVDNRPDRSEDVSELFGIHSLPTKILIDPEGMIIGRYGGGGGTEKDMDEKLKEIFGK